MTNSKALKTELKTAFPTVKFSVRSDRSGSLRVEWVDGPSESDVKAFSSKYESISYCQYSGEILSGGNRYVSLSREFSNEVYIKAAEKVCKYWGLEMPKVTIASENRAYIAYQDDAQGVGGGYKSLSWLVSEELSKTDCLTPEVEEVEHLEAVEEIKTEEVAEIAPQQVETEQTITGTEDVQGYVDEQGENVDLLAEILEARRDRLAERNENRQEAYERLAAKHRKESDAYYKQSKQISDMIPFGQPILVGHHSEKRHRRDADRIFTTMGKSVQHAKTAEYYEGKLAAMESNHVISSDDPDAIAKLEAKLADMEESQEYMERINTIVRKVNKLPKDEQVAEFARLAETSEANAQKLLTPDFCGRVGFPTYKTQNNNANMRRVRERIQEIKQQHAAIVESGVSTETEYPEVGLKLVQNREINRIQLIFDDKPSESVRTMLKENGFRWSPREMAWQRNLNGFGIHAAERAIGRLKAAI